MNGKSICSKTDREESSLAGSGSQRKKIEVHPGARGWEKRFESDEISQYLNPACSRYPALREGEGPLSRVEPRIISSLKMRQDYPLLYCICQDNYNRKEDIYGIYQPHTGRDKGHQRA